MESKPIVTITGVSGYLGSHTCLYFLKSGQFRVRGTVRSLTNAKKIDPLKKAFGEYFDQLELVEADLGDRESLIKCVEGADYLVHTASPFPIANPKDPMEVIGPAVDGTLALLEGCRIHKVKRCVYTSSQAAIMNAIPKRTNFDHNVWSDTNAGNVYMQSKTRTEKAAWEYFESLPEHEKFEFVSVLPGGIVGPALITQESASLTLVKMMMLGQFPGLPSIKMTLIDVRDCARHHFQALTVPEANGKRFLSSDKILWMEEIADILREKYGKDYKVSKGKMYKALCWLGSLFSSELKLMWDMWGLEINVDNSQTVEVLGAEFIDVKQTIHEMAESMIEQGYLPDQRTK